MNKVRLPSRGYLRARKGRGLPQNLTPLKVKKGNSRQTGQGEMFKGEKQTKNETD